MGNKKKRTGPTIEEAIERPWCYYCERDFVDQKVLIDHQKAKHYSCPSCNRKLNTAGGLSVHLQQVHKETLTHIENAIEGRQKFCPEIEIFGMMGIPDDLVEAHKQRITNEFFKVEAERSALTGNPPPGQVSGQPAAKKRKTDVVAETPEQIQKRKAEWRAQRAAKKQAEAEGKAMPASNDASAPAETPALATASVPTTAPTPVQAPIATHPASAYATAYSAPNYGAPNYSAAHSTYCPQPHVAPPQHAAPAQGYNGQGYNAQGYNPYASQYQTRYSPPNQLPFSNPPHQPIRLSPSQNSYNGTPPTQIGGLPRQNSLPTVPGLPTPPGMPTPPGLPTAPGLPARPAFDPPSVNRQHMQALHSGQVPPSLGNVTASDGFDVDKMLDSAKREHKEKLAAEAAEASREKGKEFDSEYGSQATGLKYPSNGVDGTTDGVKSAGFQSVVANKAIVGETTNVEALGSITAAPTTDDKPKDKTDKTDDKTDGKKKKSKPSRSRLIFSNSEHAPEELMARWLRFFYERENGVEWSEGPVGAAVTGVTVDEDTVLDPQN